MTSEQSELVNGSNLVGAIKLFNKIFFSNRKIYIEDYETR